MTVTPGQSPPQTDAHSSKGKLPTMHDLPYELPVTPPLTPELEELQRRAKETGKLPTMYDLPSEYPGETGLPDEFHSLQPRLLSQTLKLRQYTEQEVFSVMDMNLYYDPEHLNWYKRPDWYLVVGVPRQLPTGKSRSSYVLWDEKVSPIVVVEFLSPGTEAEDLGRFAPKPPQRDANQPPCKFDVYERIVKVQHYIVYDEENQNLRYFRLVNGQFAEQLIATQNPRLWIPELDIGLGIWEGEFAHMSLVWLRWCDRNGNFLMTDTEIAEAKEQQAREEARQARASEQQAREEARSQLRQTVLNLLNLGMPIAQVAQVTGLTEDQVQEWIE